MKQLCDRLKSYSAISFESCQSLSSIPCKISKLDAGKYIVYEGDTPGQCVLLISGFAHRHKITDIGDRQVLSIHVPGDLLDLQHLFLDIADHNIQTLTPVTIASFPRSALRTLFNNNSDIARAILTGVSVEASMFREWTLNVGRRDARARIAHLLCELAIRLDIKGFDAGQDYEMPMSQEQIGDAVGLTTVHVNRVLRALEEDGLIVRDRRYVSFPAWPVLRRVAGFDERYLHRKQQVVLDRSF